VCRLERASHFPEVAREIVLRVQVVVVVEVDDESLVRRVGGLDECNRRRIHLRPLRSHAAAVVHDQAEADGNVFLLEDGQLLLDFVLQDLEVVLYQSGDEHAAVIQHGNVQNDQVGLRLDPKSVIRRRRLRGWRRGRLRAGRNGRLLLRGRSAGEKHASHSEKR
jgi:hypothetical protein